MITVYKITCVPNEKRYIGITINALSKRWRQHLADARKLSRGIGALHQAIRHYGEHQFTIEVICEVVDLREACAMERSLIASHNTMRPNGYNLTSGGESTAGTKHSVETVEKNRLRNLGKTMSQDIRQKISAALKGRRKTEDHRQKVVTANAGRKHSEETKQKLRKIGLARMVDPAARSAMAELARVSGPKISAAKKLVWANPEFRAKRKGSAAHLQTPEMRIKQGEALKALWGMRAHREKMILARNASPKVQAYRALVRRNKGKFTAISPGDAS